MFFVIFVFFHVSTSYMNELVFCILRTFNFFCLGANKENFITCQTFLHIIIILWHKFIYFNMTCNWHMNMCCLIRFHVDMLTLFKWLLPKEQMPMQKLKMKGFIYI
jgi:hypothetical protein